MTDKSVVTTVKETTLRIGAYLITPRLVKRFWKYVRRGPACWLWTGTTINTGYGTLMVPVLAIDNRTAWRNERAPRLMWMLIHNEIPIGMIRHICDIPRCVRPDHLIVGTAQDNINDMIARDRMARGERRGNVVLTESTVLAIREAYASNPKSSYWTLAKQYGVASASIGGIVRGKTWRHVGGPRTTPRRLKRPNKMTAEQVKELLLNYAGANPKPTIEELRTRYGLCTAMIHNILYGKVWRHVFTELGFTTPLIDPRRRYMRGKVSAEQVEEIRRKYAVGDQSMADLAREYGITPSGIRRIVRNLSWTVYVQ